jgi:zinc protease
MFKNLALSFLILALSLNGPASFSQFRLTDRIPLDSSVRLGRLANGLRYYIRKNNLPAGKVQLRLVVNAGSVLEDPDQQGLAHMMEHMNFNGSKHFPKNELVSYLQSIGVQFGADLNAYTGFDETVYILPIPSDDRAKVEKGFTILEDWAAHALLDSIEIDKERGVVLEESRLGKGADERLSKQYFPKIFNGSRYAERIPIGKDDTIRHFKYATLRRFYRDWYRPDLMAVIVVGDIDPARALEEITRHFASLRNPGRERARPALIAIPARAVSEGMVLTDKEEPYKFLQIIDFIEREKPTVTWSDYRHSLVEELFTAMINQRLSELTQQANPPYLFANTGFGSFIRGYRAFSSFAVLGQRPAQDAIDSLVQMTESVRKFGFLAAELQRAKITLLTQAENAYRNRNKTESPKLVQAYINHFLEGEPIPSIGERYAFLKAELPGIPLSETNAVAKETISNQGSFVLLTAPGKDSSSLPDKRQLLAMLGQARTLPVKAYQEKNIAQSLMESPPSAGRILSEKSDAKLGTTDLTLSNGVSITIRPTDFKNNEIKMDGWRPGGSRNFGLENKANAENAAPLIQTMGVKDLSNIDLQKFLAGKTIEAQPYINSDEEGIQGTCAVKDFETFLQLVHLYFTRPRRDEALFQSYISSQKSFVQNLLANPETFFNDTLIQVEFQNNPWANGTPKPADFDRINLDSVMSIYRQIYGNAYGMHFTLVGNLDPVKSRDLLARYLGSLPSEPRVNHFTDRGLRPVRGSVSFSVRKGTEKKSQVNLLFTGNAPYSNGEALKLRVLTDVLNIKIIEQLREEMSGIYGGGLHGEFEPRPYNHYSVELSFPCGPENVEKLEQAAYDILKTAQDSGIEIGDLNKVKETLKKQNQDQMRQNEHWLDLLSTAWINGSDPTWIFEFAPAVERLTPADIQETARKYLSRENCIQAVLYPEK